MSKEREFAATTYSKTLLANGQRMNNEIAPLTISAYEARWKTFVNAQDGKSGIRALLTNIVSSVKEKAISKDISWSTVRLYKATICYGLTLNYLAKFYPTSELYRKLKEVANFKPIKGITIDNSIDSMFFERLYTEIKDFNLDAEDKGEGEAGGKTSSSKAKQLPKEIYDIILSHPDYAGKSYELLRLFVEVNCIIGLRPIEWFDLKGMNKRYFDANIDQWFDKMSKADVEVVTDRKRLIGWKDVNNTLEELSSDVSVILIKNGKNSLGRAGIEYRALYSSDKDFYRKVNHARDAFLEAADAFAKAKQADGDSSFMDDTQHGNILAFKHIMRLTQRKMRYIIDKDAAIQKVLKRSHNKILSRKKFAEQLSDDEFEVLKQNTPMKIPSIYSTRHQAVANAKDDGMSAVAIAAMFGHSSVITAQRHYGKAASGRSGSIVRPSERNINNVLLGITEDQLRIINSNETQPSKERLRKDNGPSNTSNGFSL